MIKIVPYILPSMERKENDSVNYLERLFSGVHDFMARPLWPSPCCSPFWRCLFCCWSIFERTFLARILRK